MPTLRQRRARALPTALLAATLGIAPPRVAAAQENYEIQVYGSETVPAGRTMFELHSNVTLSGRRTVEDGMLPTEHAWHETVEITHGFNDWSELGFYTFTSARSGQGWRWVGNHLRPRVRAPERWGWPVGASLSLEFGYQQPDFAPERWSIEIRPIIDKQLGRWYASLNPTLERALVGEGVRRGLDFAPNATLGFDATSRVNLAVEYYGAVGTLRGFDPSTVQEHQLFGVVNLDFGAAWEFNAGYGQALSTAGDRRIAKVILGRRVGRASSEQATPSEPAPPPLVRQSGAAPEPAAQDPRSVQPERPTVATHAFTVAAGYAEIETGVEADRADDGARSVGVPTVLKIGLARRAQLSLFLPGAQPSGLSLGVGDVAAGVKWRLVDEAPIVGAFAVLPTVKWATGGAARGTGTTDVGVLLISSHHFGGVALDVNAGATRRSGDGSSAPRSATSWTVSSGIPVAGPWGLALECFGYPGTGGPAGVAPTVAILAGPTLAVRKELALDAGFIVPVAGPQPRALYAGGVVNVGRIW